MKQENGQNTHISIHILVFHWLPVKHAGIKQAQYRMDITAVSNSQ